MGVHGQSYPCDDLPYYTLDDELYANSPSRQMEFTHILIGLFDQLSRRIEHETETVELYDEAEARVGIRVEYLNGVRTVLITPGTTRNDKKIVYFHGGGYSNELIPFQWDMAVDVAKKAGSPVYLVEYGLVPDHIFPVPIEDGFLAYTKLLESFDASEIVFMGDSAGGGIGLRSSRKIKR